MASSRHDNRGSHTVGPHRMLPAARPAGEPPTPQQSSSWRARQQQRPGAKPLGSRSCGSAGRDGSYRFEFTSASACLLSHEPEALLKRGFKDRRFSVHSPRCMCEKLQRARVNSMQGGTCNLPSKNVSNRRHRVRRRREAPRPANAHLSLQPDTTDVNTLKPQNPDPAVGGALALASADACSAEALDSVLLLGEVSPGTTTSTRGDPPSTSTYEGPLAAVGAPGQQEHPRACLPCVSTHAHPPHCPPTPHRLAAVTAQRLSRCINLILTRIHLILFILPCRASSDDTSTVAGRSRQACFQGVCIEFMAHAFCRPRARPGSMRAAARLLTLTLLAVAATRASGERTAPRAALRGLQCFGPGWWQAPAPAAWRRRCRAPQLRFTPQPYDARAAQGLAMTEPPLKVMLGARKAQDTLVAVFNQVQGPQRAWLLQARAA